MMPASVLLLGCAALLSVPVAVLFVEVVAACLPPRHRVAWPQRRGRLAVLVPAHNESSGLVPTLEGLGAELQPGDRLIVVADNMDDAIRGVLYGMK